jgi:hypothetical protein
MSLRQNIVYKRLVVLGVEPRQAQVLINQINAWIAHNGFEWTISRLKQIKVSYIQHLAGKPVKMPWISHTSTGPKGPFKYIWKLNNPNKALNALMIYTDLVSPRLTDKQWQKFSTSAQQTNPSSMMILWPEAFPYSSRVNNKDHYEIVYPQSLQSFKFKNLDRISLKSIRTPQWRSESFRSGENTPYNMARTFRHELAVNYLYDNYDVRNGFPSWFQDGIMRQFKDRREMIYDHNRIGDCVGRISFIQEPGYKLRAVANPFISLQILLEPLKRFVMNGLKTLSEDYAHDQEAAILSISHNLRYNQELKLSSIDLSDATNNIPLQPQIELLETLLGPKHPQVELFRKVSRGTWYVDSPSGETTITFNNGQPLGSGPSFGVFSLFHHFVARCAICDVDQEPNALVDFFDTLNSVDLETGKQRSNPVEPSHYLYWIVGDDIVIDEQYAQRYIDIINGYYHVPISIDKCIFNSRVAEFCSRIISEDKISHAFKWKTVSDSSFLHVAKSLGPKSLPLFRPKQQRLLKRIGYIPDTIGGPVSWNPEGIPLGIREEMFWKDAEMISNSKSATSRSVRVSDLNYQFYRDLKIILSFNHNPLDIFLPLKSGRVDSMSAKAEEAVDPVLRQKELLLSFFADYFSKKGTDSRIKDLDLSQAFLLALKRFPNVHFINLSPEELLTNNKWSLDPLVSHVSEIDVYFEKLCTIFNVNIDK